MFPKRVGFFIEVRRIKHEILVPTLRVEEKRLVIFIFRFVFSGT